MTEKTDAPLEKPRRFYRQVDVVPHNGGFIVTLDGRMARTPQKAHAVAPTKPLADLLAQEWDRQKDVIDLARMPAVRLASTAIDRVGLVRAEMAAEVASFGGSDLLCYFADSPVELVAEEKAAWTPWLDWAARELDVALTPATGVIHQTQPAEALARLEQLAAQENDFLLAGLGFATPLYGSAILAMAVRHGALDAVQAFEISRIDEAFQVRLWGVDAEAEARRQALRLEAEMIGRWFDALGSTH